MPGPRSDQRGPALPASQWLAKAEKASVAEVDERELNPLITSISRRRRSNDAGPGDGEGVALSFAALLPDDHPKAGEPLKPASRS